MQSRYYNPEVGRFLNADGYITTDIGEPLAFNMFAYCGNNPVMYSDPSGCSTDEYSSFFDCMLTCFEAIIDTFSIVIGNSSPPSNIGAGAYAKQIAAQVKSLEKFSKGIDILGDIVAYGFVALEALINASENYLNGESSSKIMWDITVDVTVFSGNVYLASWLGGTVATMTTTTLCAKFGAFVGSFVPTPVVGIVLGATVGFGVGVVLDEFAGSYVVPYLKEVLV